MAHGYGYLDDLAFLLGPGPTHEQKMRYVETHRRPEGNIGFKLLPAAMRKQWLAWWDLMEQAKRHGDEAARGGGGEGAGEKERGRARDRETETRAQAEEKLDEMRGEGGGEVRYSQWTWPPRGWEGMTAEQMRGMGEGAKEGKGKDKKKDKEKDKGKGKEKDKGKGKEKDKGKGKEKDKGKGKEKKKEKKKEKDRGK
ncbi:hypothetical protein CDD81_2053 [Ophiocordyceps australis]|uniref:Uncharacterized protein n=1 Tax=Ophiocordyceps australis TaxID=1399860 RepID=A0A2C5XUP0_9HYPO|nr:hypothetical protein CDD81_2053 [Ophiocordyceps australis]